MSELMEEYRATFGETFPLMACMDMSDAEISDEIRRCIDSKTPYRLIGGVLY